ncbi:hypothetical protein [Roseomonas sp. BN140053]
MDVLSPDEQAALERRRRARNWALLLALLALVGLFYLVAITRMGQTA